MEKLLFVFNPNSGKSQIKNNLFSIIDIFAQHNFSTTVFPTQKPLDAYNIIKNEGKKYKIVVCSGGDGTLSEAVKALMTFKNKPLLGYIPSGTTNDFGYSLNISKNMEKAAETIIKQNPFACDVGMFNNEYFSYIAAFGAFTQIPHITPQQNKKMLGYLAYILEGLKHITNIKSYEITVSHNGKTHKENCILGFVSNTISVAGYRRLDNLNIYLNDGLFEVCLVKTPKNAFDIQNIISSVVTQKFDSPYVELFRTNKLKIKSDTALNWTLDGEDGGYHNTVKITNIKQAINILVDK